jgi:hypothetical protein
MAMKKDDDKSKRTLSGKKPATFGGANSKLMASKPKASVLSGPRAEPSRPMGKDASGSANFNRTSPSRATVSVGPATMSMGGKTTKSKGGMNMNGGKVMPKKSVNPTAKMSPGVVTTNNYKNNNFDPSWNKSNTVAASILGGAGLGAALSIKKVRQGIAKPFKYIADTKERKARNAAQKAENDAMIVERKAKQEAKNPSTPVAKVKASKSTMKNIKRLKKSQ